MGQKKEVKIHRFVVKDSVEEKILLLQEKKLNLANDVLTGSRFSVLSWVPILTFSTMLLGAKRSGANKLTMNDLKMLFQVS